MRYKITSQNLKDYMDECRDNEQEAQHIYCAIQSYFHHNAETVYEDVIIDLVGQRSLALLREFRLIESCAVINGRKLYAL